MAASKTSLSAGLIIYELLKGVTEQVYPVVADLSVLPYVRYFRRSMDNVQTKTRPSDTVQMEVDAYAKTYEESVSLAEEIRSRLECNQKEVDGMKMRSCVLVDSEEGWESDAYYQTLIFEIKI